MIYKIKISYQSSHTMKNKIEFFSCSTFYMKTIMPIHLVSLRSLVIVLRAALALHLVVASQAFALDDDNEVAYKRSFNSTILKESETVSPLHWVKRGSGEVAVIAIHGTPGSWTSWQALMNTKGAAELYSIYAIDRMGWGQSGLSNGGVIADFNQQQAYIQAWYLKHVAPYHSEVLVVGHSWGAAVAAALVANNPNNYDGALLVAGPFDPALSLPRWYHRWATSAIIQKLIGPNLSKSNLEMLPLSQSLQALESVWPNVKIPIVILQGQKDWLVDYKNAQYLYSRFTNAKQKKIVLRDDLGHFFIFSKPEIILQQLNQLTQLFPKSQSK